MVFNVEYDALPGIGHACGHNLIATGSLAAFLGTVGLMKQYPTIPGRVRVLGTPAEEGGGGKVKLIDAGAYKNVDACLMTHPMSGAMFPAKKGLAGMAYGTCIASAKFRVTFTGRPAHAAAAPHNGINALDAAVLAYNGISMLRQQILPSQRIHGIIMEGGEKANVIPSRSKLDFNVRSETIEETKVLQARVMKCFEGAALATGCEMHFEEYVSILLTAIMQMLTLTERTTTPRSSRTGPYALHTQASWPNSARTRCHSSPEVTEKTIHRFEARTRQTREMSHMSVPASTRSTIFPVPQERIIHKHSPLLQVPRRDTC